MNEIIYKTEEECLTAINTLKVIGIEIPEWMSKQLEAFKTAKEVQQKAVDETPIWATLQANYPYGTMPEEKKNCVEDTVAKLLEDGEDAEEPCLLLGKIQCGKTDTFEDIIGLSFDKGIDIAVVITKGTKALVSQTIKRMANDFRFFKESDNLDQKATIKIFDIMDIKSHGLRKAQVETTKTVIVCKKNAKNLEHLINLFSSDKFSFLREKKVLIVDDEADFASRNYTTSKVEIEKDEDGNPLPQEVQYSMAKISQQIDDFRKIPAYCRYLQVTATPYCLYLQPKGDLNLSGNKVKAFRPRYTSLVPVHDLYVGGQQYYVESQNMDSMYSHLFHPVSDTCLRVLGRQDKRYLNASIASKNLYDLTYALIAYFMSSAIRRIQVKDAKNKDYKTSAVIHVEIDKKNHEWERDVINRLIGDIKKAIVELDNTDKRIWTAIDALYEDFVESNKKGREEGLISVSIPDKEDVLDEIREIFNPYLDNFHVQMVNSDEEMTSLLDEETGELKLETAATIFVGGNILDRGVTIKNMLCFFYGRDPGNFQQDTVLQHARMYGARTKEDMAVTRFHTSHKIYKILVRMNELDEQLRQWFIDGKDQLEPNAIFVGYDSNIKPCSSDKIKVANAIALKPHHRVVPAGFWTGANYRIQKTIARIDALITGSADYGNKDKDGFFVMDKETVAECLKLIESTFVYDAEHHNLDRKNDMKELLCALEYCCDKSGGKVYILHKTDRNMTRLRDNGGFIDAPHDGKTELKPSYNKAQDAPVMMFLRENGAKKMKGDVNVGWNDAPFYWPVLVTQKELDPVMFSIDVNRRKRSVAVIDYSEILEGINPKDVLYLTFLGSLEDHFGAEGTEYSDLEDCPIETRILKETTAAKYILKDENNDWAINPKVVFDKDHYSGLYSSNNNVFPFVFRPYKYMLLRNGRNAMANLMLLELFPMDKWKTGDLGEIDENGNLVIKTDKKDVLLTTKDTYVDKDLNEEEYYNEHLAVWAIGYPIKRVVKFRTVNVNWDKIKDDQFDDDVVENY